MSEQNGRPHENSGERNGNSGQDRESLPSPSRPQIGQSYLTSIVEGNRGDTAADVALLRRAAVHQWQIPQETRELAVQRLHEALELSPSRRTQINAAKGLAGLDAINVRRERNQVDVEQSKVSNNIAALRLALAAKSTVQGVKTGVISQPTHQQTPQIADNSQAKPTGSISVELPPGRGVYDCLE